MKFSTSAERTSEEWYGLQYSRSGDDDWFAAGSQFDADTLDRAIDNMKRQQEIRSGDLARHFDWRIVKKTLTTEMVGNA